MMTRDEIEQVFGAAFAAAKRNIYVQRWQQEFPELWSDEQLSRNVPLRVEFEHVYVFGTVAEAVSWARRICRRYWERSKISASGEASSASMPWLPTIRWIRGA